MSCFQIDLKENSPIHRILPKTMARQQQGKASQRQVNGKSTASQDNSKSRQQQDT